MPKINANIQFMFNEYELLDRYDAAARAGFKGVEIQAPYSEPTRAIQERLERNNLKHVIINLPVTDPETGLGNLALQPDKVGIYQERVALGVEYAAALGCIGVNTGIGPLPEGADPEIAYQTYIDNLRYAADELAKVGVHALIEPINTQDQPGFLISTSAQGMQAIADANHPNVFLQYDFYHMQIMEGRLVETFGELLPSIKHVQFADTPGRNEPGTGEIHYPFIFQKLDELGYTGWTGAEYNPSGRTEDSLDWFRAL
ncbi:MAG: TIM barrel protein [Chloroflexi bacterium]|nr:TIM barrel protein [Chloroflexota bacterium]